MPRRFLSPAPLYDQSSTVKIQHLNLEYSQWFVMCRRKIICPSFPASDATPYPLKFQKYNDPAVFYRQGISFSPHALTGPLVLSAFFTIPLCETPSRDWRFRHFSRTSPHIPGESTLFYASVCNVPEGRQDRRPLSRDQKWNLGYNISAPNPLKSIERMYSGIPPHTLKRPYRVAVLSMLPDGDFFLSFPHPY